MDLLFIISLLFLFFMTMIRMFDLENLFKRFSFEKNDNGFRIYNLIILIVGLSLYLLNNHFLHEINWFFMFYFNDFLAIVVLLSFLNVIYPYKLTNVWLIIVVGFIRVGICCLVYQSRSDI